MAVLCYNVVVMYITAVPIRTKEGKLSHLPLEGICPIPLPWREGLGEGDPSSPFKGEGL